VNWLRRLAAYERPWVGRVGWALVTALWLLVTVVGFAASVKDGLVLLILGGAFAAGEAWIVWSGRRDTNVALFWHAGWRIGLGVTLIALGVVKADGWAIALPVAFGGWIILSGLLLPTLWLLETRGLVAEDADTGDEDHDPRERS
jgi:hypothetical protein